MDSGPGLDDDAGVFEDAGPARTCVHRAVARQQAADGRFEPWAEEETTVDASGRLMLRVVQYESGRLETVYARYEGATRIEEADLETDGTIDWVRRVDEEPVSPAFGQLTRRRITYETTFPPREEGDVSLTTCSEQRPIGPGLWIGQCAQTINGEPSMTIQPHATEASWQVRYVGVGVGVDVVWTLRADSTETHHTLRGDFEDGGTISHPSVEVERWLEPGCGPVYLI